MQWYKQTLEGELANIETIKDDIFGLDIPLHVPGVPDEVLQPIKTWADPAAYKQTATALAANSVQTLKNSETFQVKLKNLAVRLLNLNK